MQYFKGDETELKFYNSGAPLLSAVSSAKDDFYAGAYAAAPLGEVIYDSARGPLANAIARDIYRLAFKEIFEAFIVAGTFESYLTVFQKIFGTAVEVTFTVPAPGKLTIDIVAEGVEESPFIARRIVSNAYVNDMVVDHLGNQIVFQTVKGFTSEYELEQMLFEMVPAGVYTTITLTLGGA